MANQSESAESESDLNLEPNRSSGVQDLSTGTPRWFKILPFFISAIFFLSAVFIFFAPVPILLLNLKTNRKLAVLAVLSNTAIVAGLGGGLSALFYFIFVAVLALSLGEFLRKRWSLERATVGTVLVLVSLSTVGLLSFSQIRKVDPVQYVVEQAHLAVDRFTESLKEDSFTQSGVIPTDAASREEWKSEILRDLPSAVFIIVLAVIWSNLLLVIRLNPNRIRESLRIPPDFTRTWKAPEWLVWPTIVCGFFLIFEVKGITAVAHNGFKVLMAIYVIQGLSILSFLFDVWGLRGFLRTLAMLLAVFLMMPLVLSLGFFDLWFDFRGKFRQT